MRPAGSDLFQCKSTRSGRPSSESWIHIVSRETIPSSVIEIWHIRPHEISLSGWEDSEEEAEKEKGDSAKSKKRLFLAASDEEVDSSDPSSSRRKGKKRARAIVESDESASDRDDGPSEEFTSLAYLGTFVDTSVHRFPGSCDPTCSYLCLSCC
ncbi:hypothetical protein BC629DRAFT_465501 [Irpex lacteus]|nr:hypothetical protein BC629DRAFT_465501 [Irpex lacteus]